MKLHDSNIKDRMRMLLDTHVTSASEVEVLMSGLLLVSSARRGGTR